MTADYDVVVVGGGPAGSTMASYLAQAGISVAVIEGAVFPREHVGESLVPATTPVLVEIGAIGRIDEADFPKKYGASWTSGLSGYIPLLGHDGLSHGWTADVQFVERNQPGVDRDYTFHVDRGRFDAILLKHAQESGATVFNGIRVHRVNFDDPELVSVECSAGPRRLTYTARMVVDASGRQTMLGRQLRTKVADPVFDQYAVHSWFEGLNRRALAPTEAQADHIFVHFLQVKDSWVWQIPITDKVTSVGVVSQKSRFREFGGDQDGFFWDMVASRPDLYDALKNAQQVRPFKTEGDYSYSMKQICGDRYVLVGDAARFVDPIFSSGVSVALNSARIAAQDIIAAHQAGDFGKERFATYENKLRRAVKYWYEFISIYYRLNVLFTAFVQDPRYRLDVLKMLQGDVYDGEEPKALAAMREVLATVEGNPDHLWHKYLGTLKAPTAAPSF